VGTRRPDRAAKDANKGGERGRVQRDRENFVEHFYHPVFEIVNSISTGYTV
jgi:hypothetical protein